ncbi:MAG: hypothetical protein WCO84_03115 [bacterium]
MIDLLRLLERKGMTPEKFKKIIDSNLLEDFFELDTNSINEIDKDEFRRIMDIGPKEKKITINQRLTLTQMITAGDYNFVDPLFTKNISSFRFSAGVKKEEIVCEYMQFENKITPRDADKEIRAKNYRSTTIEEILTFGIAFPKEQTKGPIVTVGTSPRIDNIQKFPGLNMIQGRSLVLYNWFCSLDIRFRFLVVKRPLIVK